MISTLLAWLVPAILLFWCVGAYNRLVRLRGEVKASFGAVDAELQRHIQLVQALPADQGGPALWSQVTAATAQLATSLAAARLKPLDPQGIAALQAAAEVLEMAWERAEREDAHDLAGPRLPETLSATREQMVAQVVATATQFNESMSRYNQAIGQFPAVLLAWVFGFKPGRAL